MPGVARELFVTRPRPAVRATHGRQHRVGQIQRARVGRGRGRARSPQLVVAERPQPETLQLLTRPIVRRDGLHRTPSPAILRSDASSVRHAVHDRCAFVLSTACSEPPQKEIDRAQGAIDAARAAGAEQYAPRSFAAATTALQQSHEAVEQRDYRLALTRAVDANERAQEAAKQAADGKARARTEAETRGRGHQRRAAAARSASEGGRGGARRAARARARARGRQDAAATLQKARTALSGGTTGCRRDGQGARGAIRAQIAAVGQAIAPRTVRQPKAAPLGDAGQWRPRLCGRDSAEISSRPAEPGRSTRIASLHHAEPRHFGDRPPPSPSETVLRPSTRRAAYRPARHICTSRAAPPYVDRRHRGGAGAGAGRLGRSDAALPDQDADAIGRLDRARARRWCLRESAGAPRARTPACAGASSVTSPSTTHCGLPTRRVTASTSAPPTSIGASAICRAPHGGAKRVAAVVRTRATPAASAGLGLDAIVPVRAAALRASQAARHRTPLPETSERLPSALNSRIETPAPVREYDDQAVGADAAMPIAHGARERRPIARRRRCRRVDQEEVVAERVRLDERIRFICGRTRAGASRSGVPALAAAR